MKKKILFIMMLIMTLTGSYTSETNAASNTEIIKPDFVVKPRSEIVLEGFNVTITAKITGKPYPTVNIYHNDYTVENDKRHTKTIDSKTGEIKLTITDVQPKDDGKYTIVAQNKAGIATASCELIVLEFDDEL